MEQDMPKRLTDYEMMIYYNPYFHEIRMAEIKADKEDLYHRSCSWTDYDEVDGIRRRSESVEHLGEKLLVLSDLISTHERQYAQHRKILQGAVAGWDDADIALLDTYFKRQLSGGQVRFPRIDDLKYTLYPLEWQAREDREQARGIDREAYQQAAIAEWLETVDLSYAGKKS